MSSLYELRTRAGITQARVAKKAGCSQALLSSFETGDRVPSAKQIASITAAIEKLAASPFGEAPHVLTEYERRVWDEVSQICPKGIKVPSRGQCIRLVKLIAKVRKEGIGDRDGKHGVTVAELERLIYLFDMFKMTPASRNVIPWKEPQSATDARNQLAVHGVK